MKVVQIGVGGWGKNHSRILSEFDVLSAVCDANLERAEEFGKKSMKRGYEHKVLDYNSENHNKYWNEKERKD